MCQRDGAAGNLPAASAFSRELRASYTRAVYRVDSASGPMTLRVGDPCPELDRWLEFRQAPCFAFLSAANPGSTPLSAVENRLRHRKLLQRLCEIGFATVAGESYDAATGGWREASLLVVAISRPEAISLARDFGQLALLWGEVGGPVELVSTSGAGEDS
jgi:hypothetical protein